MYDEVDERIVGYGATFGSEQGGQSAMHKLLDEHPRIDLVYAINEPAAAGARLALVESGVDAAAVIVSVDGSCDGVEKIATGELDATAMQFPAEMANLGIEAIVNFKNKGLIPQNTPGLDFYDTAVVLVTNSPMPSIASITANQALELCW